MNIDDLTLGQMKQIKSLTGGESCTTEEGHSFDIGKNCLIRTVTHIYTGLLIAVHNQELVLQNAAWIADTGRFADSLEDFAKFNEVEPFPDGKCIIGRGSLCDYHSTENSLPRSQK
tara:strand:+ start:855 stop:1202 length:348 start_codon:yes stop_codon:yes gene_type:complete